MQCFYHWILSRAMLRVLEKFGCFLEAKNRWILVGLVTWSWSILLGFFLCVFFYFCDFLLFLTPYSRYGSLLVDRGRAYTVPYSRTTRPALTFHPLRGNIRQCPARRPWLQNTDSVMVRGSKLLFYFSVKNTHTHTNIYIYMYFM